MFCCWSLSLHLTLFVRFSDELVNALDCKYSYLRLESLECKSKHRSKMCILVQYHRNTLANEDILCTVKISITVVLVCRIVGIFLQVLGIRYFKARPLIYLLSLLCYDQMAMSNCEWRSCSRSLHGNRVGAPTNQVPYLETQYTL